MLLFVIVSFTGWGTNAGAATQPLHQGGPVILRPSGLDAILQATTKLSNRANSTLSVALQNTFETGTAAQMDDAEFAQDTDAGYHTVNGPGNTYGKPTARLVAASVPRQSSYPAVALADTQYHFPARNCPGSEELNVFAKASPSAAWKISIEPLTVAKLMPRLEATSGGFGALVTSGSGLATDPSGVPATLANELTTYAATGDLGHLSKAMFGTKTSCWSVGNPRIPADESNSFSTTTMHYAPYAPNDLVAFRTQDGGALVFFTLQFTLAVTARAGHTLIYSSSHGNPGSYQVPAGTYSSANQITFDELAVVVPPASSRGVPPIQVIGDNEQTMPSTGTLAAS